MGAGSVGEAGFESVYPFAFAAGCYTLVNVEEHRERFVPGPALADDGVDTFAEPPGAGGVTEVVAAEVGELRLAGIFGGEVTS